MEDTLALPLKQRARLAHRLILSLDTDVEKECAAELWVSEIEQRVHELDTGSVEMNTWQNVRDRILRNLNAR